MFQFIRILFLAIAIMAAVLAGRWSATERNDRPSRRTSDIAPVLPVTRMSDPWDDDGRDRKPNRELLRVRQRIKDAKGCGCGAPGCEKVKPREQPI